MRYLAVVVAFTVAHNLLSAIFFRDVEKRNNSVPGSAAQFDWDKDVVHEWLSSNDLSEHYAVYSENQITTLFQGGSGMFGGRMVSQFRKQSLYFTHDRACHFPEKLACLGTCCVP